MKAIFVFGSNLASHPGKGATPAIALCAALLRALAAKDSSS